MNNNEINKKRNKYEINSPFISELDENSKYKIDNINELQNLNPKLNKKFLYNIPEKEIIISEEEKLKVFYSNEVPYYIEKLYVDEENKKIKCISIEDALNNPKMFEENKKNIKDLNSYIYNLAEILDENKSKFINNLKPEKFEDFLNDFNLIEDDENFDNELFENLKSQIDLKKNEINLDIDNYKNIFIKQLDSIKFEISNIFNNFINSIKKNIIFTKDLINKKFKFQDLENLDKNLVIEKLKNCENAKILEKEIYNYLNILNNNNVKNNSEPFIDNLINSINISLKDNLNIINNYNLPEFFDNEMYDFSEKYIQKIISIKDKLSKDLKYYIKNDYFENSYKDTSLIKDLSNENLCGFKEFIPNKNIKLKIKNKINSIGSKKFNSIYNVENKILFVGCLDGSICGYSLNNNNKLIEFKEKHNDKINIITKFITKKENDLIYYLITIGDKLDNEIKFWDLKHKISSFNINLNNNKIVGFIDLLDLNSFLILTYDGSIMFWDFYFKKMIKILFIKSKPNNIIYIEKFNKIIISFDDRSLKIFQYNKQSLKNNNENLLHEIKNINLISEVNSIFPCSINLKNIILTTNDNNSYQFNWFSGKLKLLDNNENYKITALLENSKSSFNEEFILIKNLNEMGNEELFGNKQLIQLFYSSNENNNNEDDNFDEEFEAKENKNELFLAILKDQSKIEIYEII